MAALGLRESVGVFHDFLALRTAADALMLAGIDRAQLNVLDAPNPGPAPGSVRDVEDDPAAPRRGYFGTDSLTEGEAAIAGVPLLAGALLAGGPLAISGASVAAAFAWAAFGGAIGGAVGLALALWVKRRHARYLGRQIERGGLVIWVAARTPEEEQRAAEILRAFGAADVHVHELAAPAEWGQATDIDCGCGYLDRLLGGSPAHAHRAALPAGG